MTPLDSVDREETLDELSSGLDDDDEEEEEEDDEEEDDTEEALTARNVFESAKIGALANEKVVKEGEELKVTTRLHILVIPFSRCLK